RFATPLTVVLTAADDPAPGVKVAYDAAGELIVAWTQRDSATQGIVLEVAIAPPGGSLGAPQRIGQAQSGAPPAPAATPDASALLAYAAAGKVRVSERAPGGAFGAPVDVAAADDLLGVRTAVALGPGGAAAVAWQSLLQEGIGMVTRAGAGAFGSPV